MKTLKIKPDPNCKTCSGTGEVYDSVEFWGAPCRMPSLCDCVIEQIPEDEPYETGIELDLSDYKNAEKSA